MQGTLGNPSIPSLDPACLEIMSLAAMAGCEYTLFPCSRRAMSPSGTLPYAIVGQDLGDDHNTVLKDAQVWEGTLFFFILFFFFST